MTRRVFSRWFARRLLLLVTIAAAFAWVLGSVMARAATDSGAALKPDWTSPKAMALKRTGPPSPAQVTPVLFSNLDCTLVTYRLAAGSSMKEGCFIQARFGLFDTDGDTVIFNGTDEGLPLRAYAAHQMLLPWPGGSGLLVVNPLSTGGARVGLYRNPLSVMEDMRDALGRLYAKRLIAPPDINLEDPHGKPLVVNSQTLAFSQGGRWLVAETLSGSFVRVDLSTLKAMPFAPAYGSTGSPALLESQVAVSEDGNLVAIANGYADQFLVYDLSDCGPPDRQDRRDLPPLRCKPYEYRPFLAANITGLRTIRRLRFINEGMLGFEAISSDGAHNGTYELAPAPTITSLTDYIALGDSYTSGEGAFDYLPGTDTSENTCHLSVNSYPLLLARDLFGAAGGHSAACSGAVIDDIGSASGRYRGQVRNGASLDELRRSRPHALESIETGFLPGYIAQHRFVRHWQPAVATVSIAGNDIGFGDLLRNCVAPHIGLRGGNTCYGSYEDRLEIKNLIDRTVPRWEALFNQLKREAPGTRLYAIGYPQIALSGGRCPLNVRLNRNELELAEEVIDYINHGMRKAAERSGAIYVDISRALYGHRLCEAGARGTAMNGLTAGNDFGLLNVGLLGRESYHPNALGHRLMAQEIRKRTYDFSALAVNDPSMAGAETVSTAPGAPDRDALLLSAPKEGRTVYVLVPDHGMSPPSAKRGSMVHVQADGPKDGLRPHTAYQVRLGGPGGTVLGILVSDDSGNVLGDVRIPAGTVPGGYRLDLIGYNQAGQPADITRPFYVIAGSADAGGALSTSSGNTVHRPGRNGVNHGSSDEPAARAAVSGSIGTSGRSRAQNAGNGKTSPWAGMAAAPGLLLLLAGKINKRWRFWVQ